MDPPGKIRDGLQIIASDRVLRGTGFQGFSPILSRLDLHGHAFTRAYALMELLGYPGRCLATTLSLWGGGVGRSAFIPLDCG